jgi:hypothetical protein
MLPVTLLAVDRAALCGFERNFTFLSTVRAGDLGHLSGTSAAASVSISQFSILHGGH